MDLGSLPLEPLTPTALWAALDSETRALAARALYEPRADDRAAAAEGDAAIARALRFRVVAVRRLPLEKRADYLVRVVRPDDSLASALLRALHLAYRRELLGAFLDRLGIPHDEGVIDSGHDFAARRPDAAALAAALESLDSAFARAEVDLYATTLLALDPDSWAALGGVLRGRREGRVPR